MSHSLERTAESPRPHTTDPLRSLVTGGFHARRIRLRMANGPERAIQRAGICSDLAYIPEAGDLMCRVHARTLGTVGTLFSLAVRGRPSIHRLVSGVKRVATQVIGSNDANSVIEYSRAHGRNGKAQLESARETRGR
jgi:hypothetical protein